MKTSFWGLVCVGMSVSMAGWSMEATRVIRVEIPVEAALAPATGFDDNDNVQVVVHGFLPNGCYEIEDTEVVPTTKPGRFRVRQYALKEMSGVCAEGATIPPHMKIIVPYMTEFSMGRLPKGDYSFVYDKPDGHSALRGLSVSEALAPTTDNLPYALITNVITRDIVNGIDEVEVTLQGMLNSSCTELDQNVRIEKRGDVFVLLPTIKVTPNVLCSQILRPFEKKLVLGRAKPGHYLVHARSMNGKSVNRVLEIVR